MPEWAEPNIYYRTRSSPSSRRAAARIDFVATRGVHIPFLLIAVMLSTSRFDGIYRPSRADFHDLTSIAAGTFTPPAAR